MKPAYLVVSDKPMPDLDEPMWTAPSMDCNPPFTAYRVRNATDPCNAMDIAINTSSMHVGKVRVIRFTGESASVVITINEEPEI